MNIEQLRKRHKKSQQEIAQALNITQSAYQKYENGRTEPNIERLKQLANYYNVSIDYLVGRVFQDDFGYLSPEQKDAIKILKQLNELNVMKATSYMAGLLTGQELER